ncbi:hypothetical protein M9H77_14060 [Catharanthus roseus]|uniref:Uncharacterized protein n=1 Tax=Catharanthus roseus TaxID=4058 RepID=A0ACC0BLZ3_CATRO|nr:hypothetical protein M9H77_14060 [Catharanthus roseus]
MPPPFSFTNVDTRIRIVITSNKNARHISTMVSLAEFTLGGYQGRVLLVDGFNLPISITPERGYWGCLWAVIGCKSACNVAFNQPQYCCTGDFGSLAHLPTNILLQPFQKIVPSSL